VDKGRDRFSTTFDKRKGLVMTVSKIGSRWYIGDKNGNTIELSERDAETLIMVLQESQ